MHDSGYSLLEAAAVLALAAITSAASFSGLRAVTRQAEMRSAKRTLFIALAQTRRLAYAGAEAHYLRFEPGSPELLLVGPDGAIQSFVLPSGATLASGPADGAVRFGAHGLGDNATLHITGADGASGERIVVNQRGMFQ